MKKEDLFFGPLICGATLIAASAFLIGAGLGTKQAERSGCGSPRPRSRVRRR